jgi:hypothetical protein
LLKLGGVNEVGEAPPVVANFPVKFPFPSENYWDPSNTKALPGIESSVNERLRYLALFWIPPRTWVPFALLNDSPC